jgi:hypothetical protein
MTISVMTSNKTFRIATRIRKWLTAAALMAGIALATVATANAEPIDNMHACEREGGSFKACCIGSGGTYSSGNLPSGPYEACSWANGQSLSPDGLNSPPPKITSEPTHVSGLPESADQGSTTNPVKPQRPARVNPPSNSQQISPAGGLT